MSFLFHVLHRGHQDGILNGCCLWNGQRTRSAVLWTKQFQPAVLQALQFLCPQVLCVSQGHPAKKRSLEITGFRKDTTGFRKTPKFSGDDVAGR